MVEAIFEDMSLQEEQEQFIKTLRLHDGVVYKICMMFTDRQPDNVRDLYQDIVCNLWENRGKFRGECSEATWYYRVGLSVAVTQVRKRRRRPLAIELTREMEETLAEESCNGQINELYRLIDRLNKSDKALILLYIDKLSLKDIASIMGRTEAAVGKRIQRIKEKLQTLNQEEQ